MRTRPSNETLLLRTVYYDAQILFIFSYMDKWNYDVRPLRVRCPSRIDFSSAFRDYSYFSGMICVTVLAKNSNIDGKKTEAEEALIVIA